MATARKRTSKRAASKQAASQTGVRANAADTQITKGPEFARTVIYVHGIGNKPIQSVLKCQWDTALYGFDLGERSRIAYWVNREYYPTPEPGNCASGDKVTLEEAPTGRGLSMKQHAEEVTLEDEVDAVRPKKENKPALLAMAKAIEDRASQAGAVPEAGSVSVAGVNAKLLPLLPRPVREWITRQLVRAFVRDVNDFFYVDERREVMRKSLLDRMSVGGGPFVVVAHSQGSMIAYDVLSRLDPAEYKVPLFITIGSPLGVEEVQDQIRRLTGQKKELRKPACVDRWLNFADRGDPVAIDATLSGDYAPRSSIFDSRVTNLDSPRHPHSGTGYLGLSPVQKAVRDVVDTSLFQRVAPFVIARDLVRDLEDSAPEARQKTLIELSAATNDDPRTIEERRETITKVLLAAAKDGGAAQKDLRIENLKRYIAADLTRKETELLAARTGIQVEAHAKSVERIWRNAPKRAYLEVSIDTVQARTAHAGYNARGKGIEWAVLDTGIAHHPHFAEHKNIFAEFDCTVPGDLKPSKAKDEHGHGTHVAGIVAGYYQVKTAKSTRVFSGLAPEAKLHIYKVLDEFGNGEDAWIIKALDNIADLNEKSGRVRIQGVNLSLGGTFDPSVFGCGHSPLCVELRRLWQQGVVVVIAAGNEGFAVLQTSTGSVDANMDLSIGDPANLDEAIAVGSTHKDKPHIYGVSYFSSRGPTADGRQKPDLVAPGERIISCRHDFKPKANKVDDLYVAMSGTSMAAPHVSGMAAAFLSARKEFIGYPDRVKELLLASCMDLKRDRPQQGAGMPNLTKMLLNS